MDGSEAGSTLSYEVSTDGGVTWTPTTASQSALADGSYSFRATASDAAGNKSTGNSASVTVDNTAPAAGTLSFTGLSDSGSSASDGITQDGSFSLSVVGSEAGSTLSYEVSTDGGTTWTPTTASQSALADGSYSFRATATDAAGNKSTGNSVSVTVDNTAPAAGTLSFTGLSDTGASPSDGITQDGSFSLSVVGSEGGSTLSYEVSTDGGTTWTPTTASQSALADGSYSFRATASDAAGNKSTGNSVSVTVDNTAPAAGTLSFTGLSDSGSSASDGITQDGSFSLSLVGSEAGSTLSYEVSTDGGTTWTPTTASQSALADGSYSFRATASDAAGNKSTGNSVSVTVDNTAPAAGTLSFTGLSDSGSSASDGITQDGSFSLSVVGSEAGSTLSYEVSTDGGATWTPTTASQSALADGSYSFRATASDAAGNKSTGNSASVTVDNTAPAAGTLSFTGLSDSGSSASDGITQDGSFSLSVVGSEAGSTLSYEVSTDGGATWTPTTASQSALADGSYSFRATATDAAGNKSTGNSASVTVDNTAPAAGTLSFTGLSDSGSSASDGITQDGSFSLSVVGSEGGSTLSYEVSTDGGATWTPTTASQSALADGSYSFRATATDAAGNKSTGNSASVTVDNTAPAAGTLLLTDLSDTGATDGITQDGSFSLSVVGNEGGSTLSYEVSTDGGTTWAATTANQSALTDGSYRFRVIATDAAGNISPPQASSTVLVDTVEPTLVITHDAGSLAAGTFVLTFQFSEAVTGFDASDIALSAGTQGAFVAISPTHYTLVVTPPAGAIGTLSVSVAAGQAQDGAVNLNQAAQPLSLAYDTVPPTVNSVAISAAVGGQNSTLNAGDTVSVTVEMSKPTVVSGGAPSIKLDIGGTLVDAAYVSGSGSTALVFAYTVLAGQNDSNGISIVSNGLVLNGASLRDGVGRAAVISHAAATDNADYLVDTTAPTLAISSSASSLKAGETALISFGFSEDPLGSFTWDDATQSGSLVGDGRQTRCGQRQRRHAHGHLHAHGRCQRRQRRHHGGCCGLHRRGGQRWRRGQHGDDQL